MVNFFYWSNFCFAGISKPSLTHQLLLLPLEVLGLFRDCRVLLHHTRVDLAELGQLRFGGGQQPQQLLRSERCLSVGVRGLQGLGSDERCCSEIEVTESQGRMSEGEVLQGLGAYNCNITHIVSVALQLSQTC